MENVRVLTTMNHIDQQRYGTTEFRVRTLASIKPEISPTLNPFLRKSTPQKMLIKSFRIFGQPQGVLQKPVIPLMVCVAIVVYDPYLMSLVRTSWSTK